jgi:hypothetical protein
MSVNGSDIRCKATFDAFPTHFRTFAVLVLVLVLVLPSITLIVLMGHAGLSTSNHRLLEQKALGIARVRHTLFKA